MGQLGRWLVAAAVGVGASGGAAPPAAYAALPDGQFFTRTEFAGLEEPVAVRFTGDGSTDGPVFVAEARGVLKVFDSHADPEASVIADLTVDVHRRQDRGLLGFDVHPDYPQVPWMWVLFSRDSLPGGPTPAYGTTTPGQHGADPCPGDLRDGCPATVELRRLVLDPSDHRVVEQVTLLKDLWCEQFPTHSADTVRYGPDGALYVTAGDGAQYQFADYGQAGGSGQDPRVPANPCGDPPVPPGGRMDPATAQGGAFRAQDLLTPGDPLGAGGAALRVDPETGAALPDNPLYGGDPADDRHIAIGLRNPFRLTFDRTGEVWYGDVGWARWEEVDVQSPGELVNFGWPCFEGAGPTEGPRGGVVGYAALGNTLCNGLYEAPGQVRGPAFAYPHGESLGGCGPGQVISGLAFSTSKQYPQAYQGALFFADAWAGCVYAVRQDDQGRIDPSTLTKVSDTGNVVDVVESPRGRLYLVSFGGQVFSLRSALGPTGPLCGSGDDELEPNDTFATAATLAPGRYGGDLCPAGEDDWYAVRASRGHMVNVRFFGLEALRWSVHGPSRLVYETGLAIEEGAGQSDTLFRAAADGPYRLHATSAPGPGTLTYAVDARTCPEDGLGNGRRLSAASESADGATPALLSPGVPVRGVRCSWQHDVFAFDVRAGDRVRFRLTREVGGDAPQLGRVTDKPPWAPPVRTLVHPESQSSDETHAEATYVFRNAGRYHLLVDGPSGGVANGAYTLTMEGGQAPATVRLPQLRLCDLVGHDFRTVTIPPAVRQAIFPVGGKPRTPSARVC